MNEIDRVLNHVSAALDEYQGEMDVLLGYFDLKKLYLLATYMIEKHGFPEELLKEEND